MEKYISMLVKETDRSTFVTGLSTSFASLLNQILKFITYLQEAGNDGVGPITGPQTAHQLPTPAYMPYSGQQQNSSSLTTECF